MHSSSIDSRPLSYPSELKTLKTFADEGLAFFESLRLPEDVPIRVYDLQLGPDGGPGKDKAVRTLYM